MAERSVYLSATSEVAVEALMERWTCGRSAAIQRAVLEAAVRVLGGRPSSSAGGATDDTNGGATGAPGSNRGPGGGRRRKKRR